MKFIKCKQLQFKMADCPTISLISPDNLLKL